MWSSDFVAANSVDGDFSHQASGHSPPVAKYHVVDSKAFCQPTVPAVRLIVNIEPPDAAAARLDSDSSPPSTAGSTSSDVYPASNGYDWGQTYVRLRRASAMM